MEMTVIRNCSWSIVISIVIPIKFYIGVGMMGLLKIGERTRLAYGRIFLLSMDRASSIPCPIFSFDIFFMVHRIHTGVISVRFHNKEDQDSIATVWKKRPFYPSLCSASGAWMGYLFSWRLWWSIFSGKHKRSSSYIFVNWTECSNRASSHVKYPARQK